MALDNQIHLEHQPDAAVLDSLADFICGDDNVRYPEYRSSPFLTRFFRAVDIDAKHDGSTRKWWTLNVLQGLSAADLEKVILRLVDLREYKADKDKLGLAFRSMNDILAMDSLGIEFAGARPIVVSATPLQIGAEDLRSSTVAPAQETEFLNRHFDETLSVGLLGINADIAAVLQARIDEAQACGRSGSHLATIFLLGSTLEGLLLGVAYKDIKRFMTSNTAPKTREGKTKELRQWKLAELIDVFHDVNVLDLDVKKFSHVLRDFRNYIHPYQQMESKFNPGQHTVDICWQVFKAAFGQIQHAQI